MPIPKSKRRSKKVDPLSMQVSLRVKRSTIPLSVRADSKRLKAWLNEQWVKWVETGRLTPGVEIRGIFWRNTARRGFLSDWRYSEGSVENTPSNKIPHPIEDSARGDHEEARITLGRALLSVQKF